jgi:anti-sigma B factor antagonist
VGTSDYQIDVLGLDDGLVVVRAGGEIDVAGSVSFRDRLFALMDERTDRLVIDLSGVAYVDTYLLTAVADVDKRCKLEDRRLAIVCSDGRLRRALADTGLDKVVATFATLDEALGPDRPAG